MTKKRITSRMMMIGGKVMKFTMGIVYGGGADEDLTQICVA